MKLQIFRFLIFTVSLVFLTNCLTITNMTSKKLFVERLDSYKRKVLWSDFESASIFIKPQTPKNQILSEGYKQFKVTDYTVKKIKVIGDLEMVKQEVEIRYYQISRMIEKSLTDFQTWQWDSETKLWYLVTGLPNFR